MIELFYQKKPRLSRGIDRVDSDGFRKNLEVEIARISEKALSSRYRCSPYMEMLVSKGRDKHPRIIARPTVRDKLALSALKSTLHEALPDDVPRKLPNQVIRDLLSTLQANKGCVIVRGDIKSFYDSISHKKLLLSLVARIGHGRVTEMVMTAIRGAVVPAGYRKEDIKKYATNRGVPQGLPISNFLAHMLLSHFDKKIEKEFFAYHRYVDDMILLVPVGGEASAVKRFSKSLSGIGLKLNKEKTKHFSFDERFVFLGYEICDGKARPRLASVEKFIRSVAGLFSQLRQKRLPGRKSKDQEWSEQEFGEVFIEELNEKITGAISQYKQYGWVFYFNESTDLSAFSRVDKIIKKIARASPHLTNELRRSIKSVAKAFHESKWNKSGGYISNYDAIDSHEKRVEFMVRFGYIRRSEVGAVPPGQLVIMYRDVVAQRLARLDQDVGLIS